MHSARKEQGHASFPTPSAKDFPSAPYEEANSQYINTVFHSQYLMAQASDHQQAIPVKDESVYEEFGAEPISSPQTADQPRQRVNSITKMNVFIGGFSALSMLVAIAALLLATIAFKKHNSFVRSITERLESTEINVATSCRELLVRGEAKSGIFRIRPTPNGTSFSTFCDMTSGGGGWTLVASVHENNIDGKCTVGDKWSSEQGLEHSSLEASGSWENYDVFGDINSLTSSDYKNQAYYNLQAANIMIWHVPNNVNIGDIENQAFLKYYTFDGFLAENGSTLRNFFAYTAPLVSVHTLRSFLSNATWFKRIRDLIPEFFKYNYDRPTHDYIGDGGSDMYDGGNKVSFAVNNDNYTPVTYGELYGRRSKNYSAASKAMHPFMFLANINFGGLDSFRIRVVSNAGADGRGNISTYTNSFDHNGFVVGYRAFQIFDAGDPSICEVYFYISNTQKWKSVEPQVNYPRWSNSTNLLNNEIQLRGAKNIVAGYTLLSRSTGNKIEESLVTSVLRVITDRLVDIAFHEETQVFVTPIIFERGSINDVMARVPTSQFNDVKPGYIEFRAIDDFGYPYALCPGLKMENSASPSVHCIGGINSNWNGSNPSCGDFADWYRDSNAIYDSPSATGRSFEDIQSSILIFTRDG